MWGRSFAPDGTRQKLQGEAQVGFRLQVTNLQQLTRENLLCSGWSAQWSELRKSPGFNYGRLESSQDGPFRAGKSSGE